MLMIIVTDVTMGLVTNVQPLDAYAAILSEFEAWCTYTARCSPKHMRVTLWDTETNLSHGSREVNKPELVKVEAPTNEEIHDWIRANCEDELNAGKRVHAIKKAREAFCSQDLTGFRLGFKDARECVEEVMSTWQRTDIDYTYCGEPEFDCC